MYFKSVEDLARFSGEKMSKADLFSSTRLFVGLNCFQPGQSQKVHVHEGSDKFYVVLSGWSWGERPAMSVRALWSGLPRICRTGYQKRWNRQSCW
jgi:uncharacterized RmlC-like cupin family protein